MNGIVRFSVLLALMTLALNVPCHACWWDDEDGFTVLEWWDKEEEDYTNSHFEFEINEPDEPNVSDNSNYYDFVDDYGSNEESDGYGGFDDYGSNEESGDYGGFDDYGSNEESDGYGGFDDYGSNEDEYGYGGFDDYGSNEDEYGYGGFDDYGSNEDEYGCGGFDDYGSNEDEYGCGDFDDYDDNDFYDDCNDNYNDDNDTGSDTYDSFWDDFFFQDDDSWMDDGADPNDDNAPPSNDVEPIDPPGTNEGDAGGGNGGFNTPDNGVSAEISGDDPIVGWWPPCNADKWKLYNVKELKFIQNIHLVENLPNKFLRQVFSKECAANSIAIAAGIIDGTDPEITREAIRYIAEKAKYDLEKGGIPLGKIKGLLKDYCIIIDYNKFDRGVVEGNIDENKPIMAVTEIFDEKMRYLGAHMVTIVGYDAIYYYCAIGREKAAAVPKSDFEIKNITDNAMTYRLYIYNGKKGVNR